MRLRLRKNPLRVIFAVCGLCDAGQPNLDVLRDDPASDVSGSVKGQVPSRPQRTTLPVLQGDDPRFMPTGLYPKQQTADLRVPELVGALLGLGGSDSALGEVGDIHLGDFHCWRKPTIGRAEGS